MSIGFKDALDRAHKKGKVVADRTHVRAKKGTAIKKVPPKKEKSRLKGWVEITSEGEEENKESMDAAQEALTAKGPTRAIRPKERLAGSRKLRGTSQLAAGMMKKATRESKEHDRNEEDSTRKAGPQSSYPHRNFLETVHRQSRRTPTNAAGRSIIPPEASAAAGNPTTPAVGSQAMQSLPDALPDPSQDSSFVLTVRHPSEVP